MHGRIETLHPARVHGVAIDNTWHDLVAHTSAHGNGAVVWLPFQAPAAQAARHASTACNGAVDWCTLPVKSAPAARSERACPAYRVGNYVWLPAAVPADTYPP